MTKYVVAYKHLFCCYNKIYIFLTSLVIIDVLIAVATDNALVLPATVSLKNDVILNC